MLCTYCSTHNPDTNRFCGECGQPLVRQLVTVPAEFDSAPPRYSQHEETTISGPSFLGLTDSTDDQAGYLLEDEQARHSHTGWVVFSLIAVVVLAGVGWLEWNAIKTGQIEIPWLKSATAASASSGPAESATAAPATSGSAASDQNPQNENGSDSGQMVTNDSDAQPATVNSTKAESADKPKTPGAESSEGASDAEATRAAQSRIASDAANRRAQADADKSEDNSSDDSGLVTEKPAPKADAAKIVETKPPDPRQDRMLLAGEKYLYGRGVPQDCNQALIYFKAAAEKENAPAMSHLGAMYASGHCVTQNKVAAYKWFSRAGETEPGNQWISRSLNMLWRDMSPQERASVAR